SSWCRAASMAEYASPWHQARPAAWANTLTFWPLYQRICCPRSRAVNRSFQYAVTIWPLVAVARNRLARPGGRSSSTGMLVSVLTRTRVASAAERDQLQEALDPGPD